MPIFRLLITMLVAALVSLFLTPIDFRIAAKLGAIDVPKDNRRMHTHPIPRLGGLSIFFSFLVLSLFYDFKIASDLFYVWSGAILVLLIGVLDDELSLPPIMKLAVQTAAAYVSTMGGNVFRVLHIGEKNLSLGIFSLPITILFILAMINAHNFIDGLDGLCAGVSLSEALALGLVCLGGGNIEYATASFLLGGACIGFLPYNVNGAKLFMGDTGSTFLGFTLAAIAIRNVNRPLLLFLLFAVPLSDLCFAVTRRLLKGKNPLFPDRSHLHHLLSDRVGAYRASKLLCFIAAFVATISTFVNG